MKAGARKLPIGVSRIKKMSAIAKRPENSTLFSHPDATFKNCHWLNQ
jgi:hypothetical protein